MKSFTIATVALLAITAFSVYKFTAQEESYSARLRNIANTINSQNLSWKAEAPSRFQDMEKSRVKALMGALMDGPKLEEVVHPFRLSAPASFDSRTNWPNCSSIGEIRDQANCGSCWAFGAAEAMSDRVCISSNGSKQTRISAQDITSCCSSCGYGCNGGYPSAAWQYFQSNGVVSGGLYGSTDTCSPYVLAPCAHHVQSPIYPACPPVVPTPQCSTQCISSYGKSYGQDKTYGSSVNSVTGVTNMMNEISTNGPIEVAFSVYEDFLTYKTGVYIQTSGQYLGGHAVKALGYGTENGVDYWLIANSWNPTWGDQGYFKIRKGTNECGIESQGVSGGVKN